MIIKHFLSPVWGYSWVKYLTQCLYSWKNREKHLQQLTSISFIHVIMYIWPKQRHHITIVKGSMEHRPHLIFRLPGCGCPSQIETMSKSSSRAKVWNDNCILFRSPVTMIHVQLAQFGQPWGKPGLSIVPLRPCIRPPQV